MSASKWPRIKWNQANARLANAPFENLFGEQEHKMSALDDILNDPTLKYSAVLDVPAARYELAQLRADLQAAQERSAEQARQLDAARKVIERCSAYIGSIDHGENTKSYTICDAWLAANPAPQEQQ